MAEHINKVQKDFEDIEKIYNKCKNSCIEKFPQSKENLTKLLEEKNKFLRPKLNPCLTECQNLFMGLHNNYYDYIFKSNGIYLEFSDYPKWEEDTF